MSPTWSGNQPEHVRIDVKAVMPKAQLTIGRLKHFNLPFRHPFSPRRSGHTRQLRGFDHRKGDLTLSSQVHNDLQ